MELHMENNSEFTSLAVRVFNIIELVEIAGITGTSFQVIRKKLLDVGNDIMRTGEKYLSDKAGE